MTTMRDSEFSTQNLLRNLSRTHYRGTKTLSVFESDFFEIFLHSLATEDGEA